MLGETCTLGELGGVGMLVDTSIDGPPLLVPLPVPAEWPMLGETCTLGELGGVGMLVDTSIDGPPLLVPLPVPAGACELPKAALRILQPRKTIMAIVPHATTTFITLLNVLFLPALSPDSSLEKDKYFPLTPESLIKLKNSWLSTTLTCMGINP